MEILTSTLIDFNYCDFENLYKQTGFNIANILWEDVLRDNPIRKFECEGVLIFIDPPMFMDIKDCDMSMMLYIKVDEDAKEHVENSRQIKADIFSHIEKLANEIKEKLNTVQVPLNADNVRYVEEDESFYVKIGCPSPEMMTLDCDLIETIEDIFPMEEDRER